MGCGRSSDRAVAESGISSATQIEKTIHRPRTTEVTKVELAEKFWSWSGDDYKVKTSKGETYLKVSGKVFTFRDKMILLDPDTDAKICMIQEKVIGESLNDRRTFQIFTYKQKDEGQTSTETDDGTAVYRYAVVHQKLWAVGNNWGDQYNMYNYVNNEQTEPPLFAAFRETWRWEWDSKVNVFKGDQIEKTSGQLEECDIVAKFGMFDKNWWDNTSMNNRYGIEMSKDMDPILQICMAIICDAMKDDAKKD
jgi:uncharacterized protein YxjI